MVLVSFIQGRPGKAVISYMPTDMAHRVHTNQIVPVINQPPMSVFLAQPTMQPQVMTHGSNPSVPGNVVTCHTNQPNYITAPVTLSSSMQPTLTYSIGTTEVKESPKLSTVEEHVENNEDGEEKPKSIPANGHCVEDDVEKKQTAQISSTTEVKPLPKPDTETTNSPMSKPLNGSIISPPKTVPLPVTAALAKLQINGVGGKSPVKTEQEVSPMSPDKISKESTHCEVKAKVAEKSTMNGYATAARKVVAKPLLVNGST